MIDLMGRAKALCVRSVLIPHRRYLHWFRISAITRVSYRTFELSAANTHGRTAWHGSYNVREDCRQEQLETFGASVSELSQVECIGSALPRSCLRS